MKTVCSFPSNCKLCCSCHHQHSINIFIYMERNILMTVGFFMFFFLSQQMESHFNTYFRTFGLNKWICQAISGVKRFLLLVTTITYCYSSTALLSYTHVEFIQTSIATIYVNNDSRTYLLICRGQEIDYLMVLEWLNVEWLAFRPFFRCSIKSK